MEFSEKLKELRKQHGMTQEELAEQLYVSRTAVSKWESGRGYPNLDSLKTIATFFSITVDDLLSGEMLLTIVGEDQSKKEMRFRTIIFGALDFSMLMLLFLPFFAVRSEGIVSATSLLFIPSLSLYSRIAFWGIIVSTGIWGLVMIILQNYQSSFWQKIKYKISFLLGAGAVLLFVICLHPYAAIFSFILLGIKSFIFLFQK